MSQRGRPRPQLSRPTLGGGGDNPFDDFTRVIPGNADDAANVLRLRLRGQAFLSRALELENQLLRRAGGPDLGGRRPLANRIDWSSHQPPAHTVVHGRGEVVIAEPGLVLPPVVVVQPVGVHPRFLPLGANFQEGGTGGPLFTRPQDWPDAIRKNPSMRPRGVRQWGTHLVNLDDLHVYIQLGRIIYGGNRPPGRRDPIDPQCPWKAIEAAFFRETVAIILQPHDFTEICRRLTHNQRTPYQQPFLAAMEDPNQLDRRDVVEHLIRSGVIENWIRLDTVTRYAQSYLRDWARHQAEITTATTLGRLFLSLYPEGIPHQKDRHFIEDALTGEAWEENGIVEEPMDEEDEVPPLEPRTPSPAQEITRIVTPEDEKLDWGEDEL